MVVPTIGMTESAGVISIEPPAAPRTPVRAAVRAKDMILRGAHHVDPGMIESVLLRHPGVSMAAPIGEPDACAGERPVALVTLKPGSEGPSAVLGRPERVWGVEMACPEGLEPPTCCLEGSCSIQLSYGQ